MRKQRFLQPDLASNSERLALGIGEQYDRNSPWGLSLLVFGESQYGIGGDAYRELTKDLIREYVEKK